jgi:hypothetical protein
MFPPHDATGGQSQQGKEATMNPLPTSFPPSAANSEQPVNPATTAPSSNGHSARLHTQHSEPLEDQEDGYMGGGTLDDDSDDYELSPEELAWEARLKSYPRPYFVPADFMWGVSVPREAKEAVLDLVVPSYEELALGAASALERQAGTSLCFILFLEILDQSEIGQQYASQFGRGNFACTEDRQKRITQYLRLVHSKQHVANFLLRLQTLKSQSPAGAPMVGMGG